MLLLLMAAVVSMLGRKLRLPYTVGLVLTGVALALSPLSVNIGLTKSLIYTAFFPPLIFEATLQIPWKELRRNLLVILVLATLGVLLATGVTAVGMRCSSAGPGRPRCCWAFCWRRPIPFRSSPHSRRRE